MRAGIGVGVALLAVTVAGCAMDHGRSGDAGIRGDAPLPVSCHAGDPPPTDQLCFEVAGNHICGDVATRPVCVDDHWACGGRTSSDLSSCWCWANMGLGCVCTPAGWSCVHDAGETDAGPAPIDAGDTCPDDPSTLVGTPCTSEGQSCGTCPMPCSGFCNQVTCIGHTWQGLELGCADPLFECGPGLWCSRWSELCRQMIAITDTEPEGRYCTPFPAACANDCSCFADTSGGATCTDDHAGGITVTWGGP